MYILSKQDGSTVYPYSFGMIKRDNPRVIFPARMNDSELAQWGVHRVVGTPRPVYDANYQRVVELVPVLAEGGWTQVWSVEYLSEAEVQSLARARQEEINAQSREYLASTDWYVIRWQETGVEVPAEVTQARTDARAAIVDYTVR